MTTRRLLLERALLPDGWASDVALDIAGGTIAAIGGDPAGRERLSGIALPGLPNVHSHSFQRAMAGATERRGPGTDDFWTWREVMYGFLARLGPDEVEAIAAFAFLEMLERGFTAVAEFHYLHHAPDGTLYADPAELSARIAAAAAETGIGLTLLPVLYSHGGFGAQPATPGQRRFLNDTDRFLRLHAAAARALAPLDDAVLGAAPHSLRAVGPDQLLEVAGLRGPLHIHVAEQVREVEDCVAWSGQRPVEWLAAHAPLDARWTLIHATQTTAAEREAIAASGATVGLCPITEANLGDGLFEAADFRGVWGVGSDSNVEISAPGELRLLEYGQRLHRRSRNVLAAPGGSSGRALYDGALAGGAAATGRRVGRIAPGYRADLVVLYPDDPDLLTASGDRTLDAYLFSAGPAAIRTVLVGGRTVVEGGRHVARERIAARYRATMRRMA